MKAILPSWAYGGGASYLIAESCAPRLHHVFDTFTGLPEADADRLEKGSFSDTSAEAVREFLKPLGNCVVYQGFFPETAKAIAGHRFLFVHLDTDLYSATRDGLIFFYDRLWPGGVIVVDDYDTCHEGVTDAVQEFTGKRNVKALVLASGQCVLLKNSR